MRQLSTEEKEQLWDEAKKEHPGDPMLQEIRYVRLLHAAQTKDMTVEERIYFYNRQAEGEPVGEARKASNSACISSRCRTGNARCVRF